MTKPIPPETAVPAPDPIQIVLRRVTQPNGSQTLVQDSLSDPERQRIQARYNDIANGPAGGHLPFFRAFFHAAQHHPGDPQPLIVLSRRNRDEMSWVVLDQNGNQETGFTVSIDSEDGGPPDALPGFPKGDGGARIVRSGLPKTTHLRRHFKFKVVAAGGVVFDPDWYAVE